MAHFRHKKKKEKGAEKSAKRNDEKSVFMKRLSVLGTGKEKNYFLENLSALLSSGMPIIEAVFAVKEEIHSKRLRRAIDKMANDVKDGYSLSQAFDDSGMFGTHITSLVKIGERSGKLVENLKIVATEQRKERALRSKLKSATMYPIFVFALTAIIGVGIAWFILPKLATVFSQLKIQLPLVTKILIGIGLFLNNYGLIAVPIFFVLLALILYLVFWFSKTKIVGEVILSVIPGIKDLQKETELARFGYLLGTLVSAGLSPVEALDSIAETASMVRYKKFYQFLREGVVYGDSFKKSFASYKKINKLLPVPVQQLIVAGEESGTFSSILIKIGDDYEAKTDTTAKDLTVILEPILLVIVWLGVLSVAFAVILPIYSLIGGLNPNP